MNRAFIVLQKSKINSLSSVLIWWSDGILMSGSIQYKMPDNLGLLSIAMTHQKQAWGNGVSALSALNSATFAANTKHPWFSYAPWITSSSQETPSFILYLFKGILLNLL